MKTQTPQCGRLIAELDRIILAVTEAGLKETAGLLRMARIDLLTRIHGITEEEFDTLLFLTRKGRELSQYLPYLSHEPARDEAAFMGECI
jgi:hypothetical protein